MAKAENLSHKMFGYLKAIERADDHISPSGQKKVCWLCECQLCGTKKIVSAQDLKRGTVISCGCYRRYKGKENRNKKICVVCGRKFDSPPSDKTATCSKECRKEYAKQRRIGKPLSEDIRKKISDNAKGRDLSKLQPRAVEAAKKSPKAGRFETNVNAIDWHVVSPEGKHYKFRNLRYWVRDNCSLFGLDSTEENAHKIAAGLQHAKSGELGKEYANTSMYMGWRIIIDAE